jgi:hypothetical protein
MNQIKKFIIRLLLGIGIGFALIFVVSAILIFRGSLTIPRAQANPGSTCTVNDDLVVNGSLTVKGDFILPRTKCITSGKDYVYVTVTCPSGYKYIGGYCSLNTQVTDKTRDYNEGDRIFGCDMRVSYSLSVGGVSAGWIGEVRKNYCIAKNDDIPFILDAKGRMCWGSTQGGVEIANEDKDYALCATALCMKVE